MTTPVRLLTLLCDTELVDEIDRIGAAVGVGVAHGDGATVPNRKIWSSAAAVVLDEEAARRCAAAGLSRRAGVYLVTSDPLGADSPTARTFETALAVGAHRVLPLPGQAAELVRLLSAIEEDCRPERGQGAVVGILGGRGGAGASTFATALALADPGALLVDLDPWGGGIDLLIGSESATGLRWPDLCVRDGQVSWAALRGSLPHHHGVTVLSGTRREHHHSDAAVGAIIDAGRRGGATVVCDLPRQLTDVTRSALQVADLVVVVSPCDVRSCAASLATASAVRAVNPNVGLVVRGPAPGGLRVRDVAEIVALPVLAAMRPEPLLAEKVERSGLRLRPRSPLAVAAATVLAMLQTQSRNQGEQVA